MYICSVKKTLKQNSWKLTSLTSYLLLILQHVSFQSIFLTLVYLSSMVRVHSLNSFKLYLGFISGKIKFCLSVIGKECPQYADNCHTHFKRSMKIKSKCIAKFLQQCRVPSKSTQSIAGWYFPKSATHHNSFLWHFPLAQEQQIRLFVLDSETSIRTSLASITAWLSFSLIGIFLKILDSWF